MIFLNFNIATPAFGLFFMLFCRFVSGFRLVFIIICYFW
ncbi:hypothetical protein SLEP1_g57697 [Rubroshorea leprosula]|uniref:Uncharacterized protein n=1 Tax=Rubroshorea leprosula TaxID=152421 RepID=A0AAV5MMF1_9ROSI|nr:hypothetical protein SLEP1_g57697 [Rubroshorea leprosula]